MCVRACAVSLCAALLLVAEPSLAASYFVDPGVGNDSQSGSASRPWRAVAASIPRLRAGDVLNRRGGTYFETALEVAVAGTANEPIVIRSAPGERAIIDGGYLEFRTVPNSDWEPVDPARGLYRSVKEYPDKVQGYM